MVTEDAFEDEAVDLFKGLLQLDTTNPPGDESKAADYLASALADDGIESWQSAAVEGRANLVARLPATVEEPEEGPLLLAGHTDVVPAESDRWRHPPFGAVEDEGCIWGRGAVDMKNMMAMSAMVVKRLARDGGERRRDVIFAAVADEEQGCEHGSAYLVDEHPDRVDADVMLGEVGGFWQTISGQTYVPVMVAEKGQAHLQLRATGPTGHGSIPRRDTAVRGLGEAVRRLTEQRLPYRLSEPIERFVGELMETQPLANRLGLRGLLHATTAHVVIDRLLPDPDVARNFDALLHNTATPTVLEAGEALNKLPAEATCEVDGRTVPGATGEELREEVAELLADLPVEVELKRDQPGVVCDRIDGPVFDAIESVVGRRADDAIPVPYMIPGYTDARHFSRLGIDCYGFAPVALRDEHDLRFTELFHGIDERIPVEGFKWGLHVLYEVVERLVAPVP